MLERRIVERKEFTKSLDFKASTFDSATILGKGCVSDITAHGLGLVTDYGVEQGMVLRLVLPEYWAGTSIPVFAEVAWTRTMEKGFRAGLRFI
jgi:hypothetical protein